MYFKQIIRSHILSIKRMSLRISANERLKNWITVLLHTMDFLDEDFKCSFIILPFPFSIVLKGFVAEHSFQFYRILLIECVDWDKTFCFNIHLMGLQVHQGIELTAAIETSWAELWNLHNILDWKFTLNSLSHSSLPINVPTYIPLYIIDIDEIDLVW